MNLEQLFMADQDAMNRVYGAVSMAIVVGISWYGGRIWGFQSEKNKNIVNGDYAELLKSKRSRFYHKMFFLGEPNPVIVDYLRENGEL
ncbi:MAG TPA: hypothetical protein VJK03_03780 [Candidatus Nanoarchaeia archaeon]|nr:hypothetical protein [Candidatus Nanoarchaeia archaeon]